MTSYLRRISPTMALAILALVLAFSSTATAALVITGDQIKNGTITKKDVKKSSLTGKQVKNRSLAARDLSKKAIKAVGGARGFQVVTVTSTEAAPLGDASVTASCPAGKVAVSANAHWVSDNTTSPQLLRTGRRSFLAQGPNPLNIADSIRLQVTCLAHG